MQAACTRTVFSLSLVAVIALVALVLGVVLGRASGSDARGGGGGDGGGAARGTKVDVINNATDRIPVVAFDSDPQEPVARPPRPPCGRPGCRPSTRS